MSALKKEKIGDYKIKIKYDHYDTDSPRDWDNLGIMACFHGRYGLPNETDYSIKDYHSWDKMKNAIIKENDIAVILPIFMYDHGGITISTNPFSCRWDSGQIGFIFITKETVRNEYGVKRISKKLIKKVKDVLIGEVETYDQYLRGEVYYFEIKKNGELIDSSYGYYDIDEAFNEAKNIVEYYLKYETIETEKELLV